MARRALLMAALVLVHLGNLRRHHRRLPHGTFRPTATVTRQAAAATLVRAA